MTSDCGCNKPVDLFLSGLNWNRPCTCEKENCRLCNLWKSSPAYREKWSKGSAIHQRIAAKKLPPGASRIQQVWIESTGIGDSLLCTLILAGLHREFPEDQLVFSCPWHCVPWVEPFVGEWCKVLPERVPIPAHKTHFPYRSYGRESDEANTPLARNRIDYYAQYCGGVAPVLPTNSITPIENDSVIFFPWSAHDVRSWKLDHWLALEGLLLRAGYPVLVVDYLEGRAEPFVSPKRLQRLPGEILALVKGSRAVVSNDSSGSHAGGLLGIPSFPLCGSTMGKRIFSAYPSVFPIQGGNFPCSGCFFKGKKYFDQCHNRSCEDLQGITPERVFAEIKAKVPH